MVIVDSSIWIEALRRRGDLGSKLGLERLLEEYQVLLVPPVRLEVLGGAGKSQRRMLERYFGVLPYRAVPADAWQETVKLSWRLRDRGVAVPWIDLLVAHLALRWRLRVYARDRHFDLMSGHLGFLLYEPGYGGAYNPD